MEKFITKYLVFSAPSGAGKTTIIKELLNRHPTLVLSISVTTRPMRNGEIDGKDYYFYSKQQFEEAIHANRFLEFEEVHGNYYGTLIEKVDEIVNQGKTVLFDIDVMGAKSIKNNYPQACLIFIKPPNNEVLAERLTNRKSEDPDTIKKRLERLAFEYEQAHFFDHVIINDELHMAISEIEKIIING
jgi:guanylate kinase